MIFQVVEIFIAFFVYLPILIIYLIAFVVWIYKSTSEWLKNYRFLGLLPLSLIFMGLGAFLLLAIRIIGWLFLSNGIILLITSLVGAIVDRRIQIKKSKPKEDYSNLDWLKHQYYDLGRTIQDIADDQNVSMITIRKWLDKLEGDSKVKE